MKSQKKYYLSHPDKETRKFLTNFKISDPCLFYRNWKIKKIQKNKRKMQNIYILDDDFHFSLTVN